MDFTNLPPDSKAFLAPMAGVADRAFREICRGLWRRVHGHGDGQRQGAGNGRPKKPGS